MDEDIPVHDGYSVCMRKTRQGSECSMSSQRLEAIVSALMKPIKDMKQNFDMDLNSLLEDYLTEAGLRHLNGHTNDDNMPNFAEVAILLQQSANIYSRKVDYLWQQVGEIVRSFGCAESTLNDEVETEEGRKKTPRSRRGVEFLNFEPIDLDEATNINLKENLEPKSLPVLPKSFIQLEPRIISENDVHVHDYVGLRIGVVTDFRSNWNTDPNGMLCDDLDFCSEKETQRELQMLSEQTETGKLSPADSGHGSDYASDGQFLNTDPSNNNLENDCFSGNEMMSPYTERDYPSFTSPDETLTTPLDVTLEAVIAQQKISKKRKLGDGTAPTKAKNSKYDMSIKLTGTASILSFAGEYFSLPPIFIEKVVERRKKQLHKLRRRMNKIELDVMNFDSGYLLDTFVLKRETPAQKRWYEREVHRGLRILAAEWDQDFLGFPDDPVNPLDITGFRGFPPETYERSKTRYNRQKPLYSAILGTDVNTRFSFQDEEEDDHHNYSDCEDNCQTFNQDLETSVVSRLNEKHISEKSQEQVDTRLRVEEWHTSIRANLARAERRKDFDVKLYQNNVLTAFRSGVSTPILNFSDVVRKKPKEDIARFFLSTLMLANTGNVEIIKTDAEGCNDFKLHLLSMDVRDIEDDVF